MKSIMQDTKTCFICGATEPLHRHHIYMGGNRRQSEKYGCWVWLCPEHHVGKTGVHFNRNLDLMLKKMCQSRFEETHSREEFRSIFGKSFL